MKQIYKQKSGNKESKRKSNKSEDRCDAEKAAGASIRSGNNGSPEPCDYERLSSLDNQGEVMLEQDVTNERGEYQEMQEIAQSKNQNNGAKKKAAESSCHDSFDMLNYEIQNKIKEGQVLPQDSASQFGLKSSVKDDFDSSHGELQVNEGYQSLKELHPYSIFANQIESEVQSNEDEKRQQAAAGMIESKRQMEQFSDKAGAERVLDAPYNI